MTPDEFVAGLTYRDGWEFSPIGEDATGSYAVRVMADLPDVNDRRRRSVVGAIAHLPADAEETWGFRVFDAVRTLEEHEIKERLRLDGVPVLAPHAPDGSFTTGRRP